MKYEDYYQTLGVSRSATAEEIQRAYRSKARKYHPDLNKAPAAEEHFKHIAEAYEVLKDPEKRALYDQLGPNWKAGQEFRPPPGWEEMARTKFNGRAHRQSGGGSRMEFGFGGDFSDFFQNIFGDGFAFEQPEGGEPASIVELPLTVEQLYAPDMVEFAVHDPHAQSGQERRYKVRIPPGTRPQGTIRLARTKHGEQDRELLLKIRCMPHERYRIEGDAMVVTRPISPWDATLGGMVPVQLPDAVVRVRVPAGTQPGNRLRLKGKGLPKKDGSRGDCFVEIQIEIPKTVTEHQRGLLEQLRNAH